ncbi:MAG: hypothetical protein MZV63_22240 [Marinilabiliales bacterium]|nr:hypothetical protein [Marinilabiliales bacterium]
MAIVNGGGVMVERSELRAFTADATDCPDLFPPLAALAARCTAVRAGSVGSAGWCIRRATGQGR